MMLHTNSLSLSLSLSSPFLKSQTQLCEALIIQAAAAPTTQIHEKNAKVDRKKKAKKKTPQNPQNPTPQQPTVTHSLTHSHKASFTKMKFLCKFLVVSAVFFFKDTHSGRRKSTQENTIFFSREDIKKTGERKSFNKNPTKKTETKKTLDKERSKSFQKQKKKNKIVHTQPKNKQ
jgi:hypothetical protein